VTIAQHLPWTDRAGRFSWIKAPVFLALFLPAGWIVYEWQAGWLFPRELNGLIHETGSYAVRFLLLALAVTPLRHAAQWSKLIAVRRMIGIAALAYALAHLTLYCVDQKFDAFRVVSEIALRIYLTIGFVALTGLVALGVTSTDGMIRRMGSTRWARLHKLVHVIAVLGVLHFFMQAKIDAFEPTLMLGFLIYLEGCRWLVNRRIRLSFLPLVGLSVASALATTLLEAGWYGIATQVPALAILKANLAVDVMIRPSWWVLAAGLGFALIGLVRNRMPSRPVNRMATAGA
jgi:methionine sulfoxide reductase heme-binding subunit